MARAVLDAGLNPLPILPGEKAPAVKWKPWQERRMPSSTVDAFCSRYPDHNIGTPTGTTTGLLTVDVDTTNETIWRYCVARFGDTPARVRTASGKLHLHYRCPEGARNTQRLDDMPIDIRANGGFIILPPSIRPDLHGAAYEWLEGGLDVLGNLPLPKPGSIPEAPSRPLRERQNAPEAPLEGNSATGTRNRDLFAYLRGVASACGSEADLVERAQAWNSNLAEPLPDAEVRQTAGSVWEYRQQGRLLVAGCASAVLVPAAVVEQLAMSEPHAFALYGHLRRLHSGQRDAFALSIRAMAPAIRWTERRLRDARETLLRAGLLVEAHRGGKGDRDASRFSFSS
jgi:hypothetical protein